MKNTIIVAGATGNLGTRICRELRKRGATVKALVRTSTKPEKQEALAKMGVEVVAVDFDNEAALAAACTGASCLVSAVAGLKEVIVDLQTRLLHAALSAGVPRFIPSDFCTDYNDLVYGENRNFDRRRDFKKYLDSTSIQATSVYNGAFADIVKYNTPALNVKDKFIGYWGNKADWKLDFTTMDDTAAFTAEAALDDDAPRSLQIASFQISPTMMQEEVKALTGEEYRMQPMGPMEDFAQYIKAERAADPAGEEQLYAKWQQSQYMYSMFATHHNALANDRYKNLTWTSAKEYLGTFVK
jgi:hypothetical protein